MWIWIANKVAKFHAKRLNQSENIPKRFKGGGYFFWNTRYNGYAWMVCLAYCIIVIIIIIIIIAYN